MDECEICEKPERECWCIKDNDVLEKIDIAQATSYSCPQCSFEWVGGFGKCPRCDYRGEKKEFAPESVNFLQVQCDKCGKFGCQEHFEPVKFTITTYPSFADKLIDFLDWCKKKPIKNLAVDIVLYHRHDNAMFDYPVSEEKARELVKRFEASRG